MTRERNIVAAAAIATAITRWLALARTFWDADEARFILALRHFDVTRHWPHPPGFPLYIATAKIFQPFMTEFHALQAVNLIAAVLLVPVAHAFARAFGFEFRSALIAALLLAFFPNVWIFGGTAFSDVPAMVLVLGAATLFLRGQMEWGAMVAGITIGFRPQYLIVLAVALIAGAMWRRASARRIAASLTILAAIVLIAYGGAAHLSGGWSDYRSALAAHERFIMSHDSYRAPGRPPLIYAIADFLIRPYRAPLINTIVTLLAVTGAIAAIVRRRAGPWIALACFAPMAILAVLYLDWLSASRFSIAYAPLIALLMADAIALAGARVEPWIAAAIIAMMIAWAAPAIGIVHSTVSPPVAAAEWLGAQPAQAVIVDSRVAPHAAVLLPDLARQVIDINAIPVERAGGLMLFAEDRSGAPGAKNFMRARTPLAQIVRSRYFEATVVPFGNVARWNGATLLLPPIDGDGQLTLRVEGTATVRFNGRVIDQIATSATRHYRVLSRAHADNEVEAAGGRIVSFGWVPAF